eukprot:27581-Pelagococcus_subviridis.AAC.2
MRTSRSERFSARVVVRGRRGVGLRDASTLRTARRAESRVARAFRARDRPRERVAERRGIADASRARRERARGVASALPAVVAASAARFSSTLPRRRAGGG